MNFDTKLARAKHKQVTNTATTRLQGGRQSDTLAQHKQDTHTTPDCLVILFTHRQ